MRDTHESTVMSRALLEGRATSRRPDAYITFHSGVQALGPMLSKVDAMMLRMFLMCFQCLPPVYEVGLVSLQAEQEP